MTTSTTTWRRQLLGTAAAAALVLGGAVGCSDESGEGGQEPASVASPSASPALDLVSEMQGVAPYLDESYLEAAEATCQDIADGVGSDALVEAAIERFAPPEGDSSNPVDAGQASQLVELSELYVCPS